MTQLKALRLFTHQLLDHDGTPNGVHLGVDSAEICQKAHVEGETSPEIHEWVAVSELNKVVVQRDEAYKTVREAHEAGTRVTAQRDALLGALRSMLEQFNYDTITGIVHDESAAIAKARAAIAAVEGETK